MRSFAIQWADRPQWRILETGFDSALNFLQAWRVWKDDAARPRMLSFVAIAPAPASIEDLLHSAAPHPELLPLAQQLASQWRDIGPGFHRLSFEGGHVLLTVCVGETKKVLRELDFTADAVVLGDSAIDVDALKGMARLCRRGTAISTGAASGNLSDGLHQCGFVMRGSEGVFNPAWEPRGARSAHGIERGRCIVIGAGLAGSAVAASMARRGWQVEVIDAAAQPAAGASGLPAGLIAPQSSPDDNLLSRLSRAGVRMTLQQAAQRIVHGKEWRADGVVDTANGVTHPDAGWIRPAALVSSWLSDEGVVFRGGVAVASVLHDGNGWRVLDTAGQEAARGDMVVIAAATASAALCASNMRLQPVRGQVSWAHETAGLDLPALPMNGNGHFIAGVPVGGKAAWLCGSTFDRDDTDIAPRAEDHFANLERLRQLAPEVAAQLAPTFTSGSVRAWTGVRCASHDRRPLLGELAPGLWTSTAMGSRGLTFTMLCAELMAARIHAEPLPLTRKLAAALDLSRQTDA